MPGLCNVRVVAASGVTALAGAVRWLFGSSKPNEETWVWLLFRWTGWLVVCASCSLGGYLYGRNADAGRATIGSGTGKYAAGDEEGESAAEWITQLMMALWPGVRQHVRTQIIEAWLEPTLKEKIGSHCIFTRKELGSAYPKMGPVQSRMTEDRPHAPGGRCEGLEWKIGMTYESNCDIEVQMGPVAVGISNLKMVGTLLVKLRPMQDAMPFIGGMEMCFLEPPEVTLDFGGVGSIAKIPGLDTTVMASINSSIAASMVLPNRMGFKVDWTGNVDMCKVRAPEPKGFLRLTVIRGSNLTAADIAIFAAATSDPFVVIEVGVQREKTMTVMETLNPRWTKDNVFDFRIDSREQGVQIEVWDYDHMKPPDKIGTMRKMTVEELLDGGDSNELELGLVGDDGKPAGTLTVSVQWLELCDLRELRRQLQTVEARSRPCMRFTASPSTPKQGLAVRPGCVTTDVSALRDALIVSAVTVTPTGHATPLSPPAMRQLRAAADQTPSPDIQSLAPGESELVVDYVPAAWPHAALLMLRLERIVGHSESVDNSYHFKVKVSSETSDECRDSWWGWSPPDGVPDAIARAVEKKILKREKKATAGRKCPKCQKRLQPQGDAHVEIARSVGISETTVMQLLERDGVRDKVEAASRLRTQRDSVEDALRRDVADDMCVCARAPAASGAEAPKRDSVEGAQKRRESEDRSRAAEARKARDPDDRAKEVEKMRKARESGEAAKAAQQSWTKQVHKERSTRRRSAEPQFEQTMYFLLPPDWVDVTLTLCDVENTPEAGLRFARVRNGEGCLSLGSAEEPEDDEEYHFNGHYERLNAAGQPCGRVHVERGGRVDGPFQLDVDKALREDTGCYLHGSLEVIALVPQALLSPVLKKHPLYQLFGPDLAPLYLHLFADEGATPSALKLLPVHVLEERIRRHVASRDHVREIIRRIAVAHVRDDPGLRSRSVTVTVRRCMNLIKQDRDSSDPFVIVRYDGESCETPFISRNLNPVWYSGNKFTFPLLSAEEEVTLEVRDRDWNGPSEFMGRVSFRPMSEKFRGGGAVTLPLGIREGCAEEISILERLGGKGARPLGAIEVKIGVEDGGDPTLIDGGSTMLTLFKLNELFLLIDRNGDNCVTRRELIEKLQGDAVVERVSGRRSSMHHASDLARQDSQGGLPAQRSSWFVSGAAGAAPAAAAGQSGWFVNAAARSGSEEPQSVTRRKLTSKSFRPTGDTPMSTPASSQLRGGHK